MLLLVAWRCCWWCGATVGGTVCGDVLLVLVVRYRCWLCGVVVGGMVWCCDVYNVVLVRCDGVDGVVVSWRCDVGVLRCCNYHAAIFLATCNHHVTISLPDQTARHCITMHYITFTLPNLPYITSHDITLLYTTLHYHTRQYIKVHHTTLHCISLHYITPHYTTLYYVTSLYYIT